MPNREDERNFPSNPTSPIILSPSADVTVRCTEQELSVLEGTSSSYAEMQGGAEMVGHPHDKV